MTAVCLVGCDHDTAPDGGEGVIVPDALIPITFSAHEGEEEAVTRSDAVPGITRAERGLEDVLPAANKTFKVWGYKNTDGGYTSYQTVMENYTVRWVQNSAATSTSNSNSWEYVGEGNDQTIKYWDWSSTAYRFFGYAGSGVEVTYPSGNVKFSFTADATSSYTIDATPYYSRLWFHLPSDLEFGQAVTLKFLKPFSRVRFGFVSDDPVGMPLSDIDIAHPFFKPTNDGIKIDRSGTAIVTYPLTDGAGTKETLTFANKSGIDYFENYFLLDPTKPDAERITGTDYWYTVLPATNQDTYTLTVSINGEDQTCVVPAEYMNWLSSYAYTYIFKIHADKGVSIGAVQSAFTQWSSVYTKDDYHVYNW